MRARAEFHVLFTRGIAKMFSEIMRRMSVGFLKAHGHNFTLLWCTELSKFRKLPTTERMFQ